MYRLEPIYSEENTYVLYTPDGKEIEFKIKKGMAIKPKGITFIEWEALKRLKKKMMINEIPVIYEEEEERLDLDI